MHFPSFNWENIPKAGEFQYDVVKYFWSNLSQFDGRIMKFISYNTTVNERSHVFFLFVDQKLFNILIRIFYDDIHGTYDEMIEGYTKAVNMSVTETKGGKEFYYEDSRIIYCSCFHLDESHIIIEVI